jgi:hypothetical protein
MHYTNSNAHFLTTSVMDCFLYEIPWNCVIYFIYFLFVTTLQSFQALLCQNITTKGVPVR